MSADRDRVDLAQARRIAQAVKHRQGGTDQALARLDAEISRQEGEAEAVRSGAFGILDALEANYPLDIFPDPAPGQHGKSVDTCSARAFRHILGVVRLDLLRLFARRAAPAEGACPDCIDLLPGLLMSEMHKRSWRDGDELVHWAKVTEENIGRCLTKVTLRAVCGVVKSWDVDSGD